MMVSPRSRATWRRAVAVALTVATVGAASVLAGPAVADTSPVIPAEPISVSSDALPTVQINGVVWTQVVVGNTVYVGGQFSSARPAGSPAGTNEVPRSNLLAYDITTGELIAGFAPVVNGEVRTLVASPDGTRLYVGGAFTAINGINQYRIAAFDTTTGALSSAFRPSANFTVTALAASATTVWIGGGFTALSGVTRQAAGAVSAANGALLEWSPAATGGKVFGLVVSPDGQKVALGGNFTALNGTSSPGYGMGMVAASGNGKTNLEFKANTVVRNAGSKGSITSLTGDSSGVYATGYDLGAGANFEGMVKASWADGSILSMEDCHGDTYSSFAGGGLAYVAGHPHSCDNVGGFPETSPRTHHRALAFTASATGRISTNRQAGYPNFAGNPAPSLVNWFPDFEAGTFTGTSQGPWSVAGDTRYVVYGGEFVRVNGRNQQGLVRFAYPSSAPNDDGPRVSGADFTPTAAVNGAAVTLSFPANWDRDNESLTYEILRSGSGSAVGQVAARSRFWLRPTVTYVDSGLANGTYSYTVRAVDPFGNTAISAPVVATVTNGAVNALPIATFTTIAADLTATFDGRGSSDTDGSIAAWAWDYGDGTSGAGATSSHQYAAAGTYTATLTVTDDRGGTSTASKTVTVTAGTTPPAGVIASDDFERTVTSGWGTASAGGTWTTSGTASGFSVTAGTGRMTATSPGQTLAAKLGSVPSSSADVAVTTALQEPVAGGSAYVVVGVRQVGANEYRARLVFSPTPGAVVLQLQRGSTTLQAITLPGVTYIPGESISVRVRATGTSPTTLQARAWSAAQPEPSSWMLTTTDATAEMQAAGVPSLGFYIGAASTGVPRTVVFDSLRATTVP